MYSSSVAVVMAARSLIQLFRDSNPDLLHKRDRVSPYYQHMWAVSSFLSDVQGRPTEHEVDTAKEYGEMKPKDFVLGAEASLRLHKFVFGCV